jgi:RNA polymerase sigma-70 factor (ECF subfamily)
MGTALTLEVPTRTLSDEEIVAKVLSGDVGMFRVLMRRHNQRLYRAVRAVLKDEQQTEDVMQEAYLRAFSHLKDFAGLARFSTWLTRIAVHEALFRTRRAAHAPVQTVGDLTELQAISNMASPEATIAHRQLVAIVERAVDELPEGYRDVFVLRAVDGLTVAEAAEVLDVSQEAVKTRTHRANEKLREVLEAWVGGSTSDIFGFKPERGHRVVTQVMQRLRS